MTAMELDLDSSIANLLVLADRIERGEPIPPPVVRVAPEPEPIVQPELASHELADVAHADDAVDAPGELQAAGDPSSELTAPEAPEHVADAAVVATPASDPVLAPAAFDAPVFELPAAEPPVTDRCAVEPVAHEGDFAATASAPIVAPVPEPPVRPAEDALARLEAVREEISNLTSRRLGLRGRRRLEEAQAEERAILRELGFDSYLEVMLAAAAGVQPGAPSRSSSFEVSSEPSSPVVPAVSLAPPPPVGVDVHEMTGGGGGGSDVAAELSAPGAHADGADGVGELADADAVGVDEVVGGTTMGRVPGGGAEGLDGEAPVVTLADWFQLAPVADDVWTGASASVDG